MESMTNNLFVPPNLASIPDTVPDKINDFIDDDAMEIADSLVDGVQVLRSKRSRSMTPNIQKTVKSRRLNLNVVDPDAVAGTSTQAPAAADTHNVPNVSADADIMNSIVNGEPKVDLNACVMPKFDKFLYIAQFKPDTNVEKIRNFVVNKLKCDPESILCQKLISSKRDPSLPLSFVSFKIGTTKNLAKKILKKDFWPSGLVAKEFEDRSKNGKLPPQASNRQETSQNSRNQHDNRQMVKPQTHRQRRVKPQVVTNHQGRRWLNPQPQPQRQHQRQHNSTTMAWRVSRN